MNSLRFELKSDRSLVALCAAAAIALCVVVAGSADAAEGAQAVSAKKKCGKKKGKKGAVSAKKCGKKKDGSAPVVPATPPVAPPTPAPLSAAEVINQVVLKAEQYCDVDPDCLNSGYYFDTGANDPSCESRSTYTWACYGWNDEDFEGDDGIIDTTCDFLEVVQRVGLNGVTSSQDLTFGDEGWFCFPFDP